MTEATQSLLDKQAIQEVLYSYCRGVDRMDRSLTRSCWHADGSANYEGMFEGDADHLVDQIWAFHETMQTHSHQMTNMLIEINGDRAVSETYVTVVLRTQPRESAVWDISARGRYIDRWSRRAGRWAIDHRHYLNDWMTSIAVTRDPGSPLVGRRDPEDASYAAFAELHLR